MIISKKALRNKIMRLKLRNDDFTLISNNCFGGHIYQTLQLPYRSPFVGLFIHAPCYVRLLSNLNTYLNSELVFTTSSKYQKNTPEKKYPIGVLGNDIELHFLHYPNEKNALEKWNRRIKRINLNNLFITFSDNDCFEDKFLQDFENLPYKKKICFTSHAAPLISSAIWINERNNFENVGNLISYPYFYRRHFDIVSWLNGGSGKPGNFYKMVNRILE